MRVQQLGSLHVGQYANGCASGRGLCLFLNGDLYEGQVWFAELA